MSIDRIKEYRKRTNGYMTGTKADDYLDLIADYLIEQHEEKETIKCDMNEGLCNNDPVVEVGQVWRHKNLGGLIIVDDVHEYADGFVFYYCTTDSNENTEESHENLVNMYELVTMDNVYPGEWVEALSNGNYRQNGNKYLVIENGLSFIISKTDGTKYGANVKHFKPCLPPQEQPKLYTQEEYDKAVEEYKQMNKVLKDQLEADKCKAYKEGYDIGHKYGYQRAIEILQLQNH